MEKLYELEVNGKFRCRFVYNTWLISHVEWIIMILKKKWIVKQDIRSWKRYAELIAANSLSFK